MRDEIKHMNSFSVSCKLITCQQNINVDEVLAAYSYLILSSGNLRNTMPSLGRVLCIMFYVVGLKPLFLNYELEGKVLKEPQQQQESVPQSNALGDDAVLQKIKHDFCWPFGNLDKN